MHPVTGPVAAITGDLYLPYHPEEPRCHSLVQAVIPIIIITVVIWRYSPPT